MTTVLNNGQPVTTEDQLNNAIASAGSAGSGAYEIDLGANISVTAALQAVSLSAGVTLDIVGSGFALDGGGAQQGLSVVSGAVTIENLAIDNMRVVGAAGGTGNGGGAGLGGGLLVGSGAAVTLDGVSFSGDAAAGGAGGVGHSGGTTLFPAAPGQPLASCVIVVVPVTETDDEGLDQGSVIVAETIVACTPPPICTAVR
jgi:hypothetical protein